MDMFQTVETISVQNMAEEEYNINCWHIGCHFITHMILKRKLNLVYGSLIDIYRM
jgi:hypothetical protein